MTGALEAVSREDTVETCRQTVAAHPGGQALMSSTAPLRGSAVWMIFPRVTCATWYTGNLVLMGDAAATGPFSIGSGLRLAFDPAIALAKCLRSEPTLGQAFAREKTERRIEVLCLQSAAWRRWTEFADAETGARLACQIGRSGRKGSTGLGWEGVDLLLPSANWDLVSGKSRPRGGPSMGAGSRHRSRTASASRPESPRWPSALSARPTTPIRS